MNTSDVLLLFLNSLLLIYFCMLNISYHSDKQRDNNHSNMLVTSLFFFVIFTLVFIAINF